MPNNLDFVPSSLFSIFAVDGERLFHAVPKVAKFGHTVTADVEHHDNMREELEFCFRLQSAEEYAEDEVDGTFYCNHFPHLFIKLPGVRHVYATKKARTGIFIIYPASAVADFAAAGISTIPPCRDLVITPELESFLRELMKYESQLHNPGIPDKIDLVAFRLIAEVFSQGRLEKQLSRQHRAIYHIASYLECHIGEYCDIDALATKHGFSRRNFFRCWSEIYPMTPAQFILNKKIILARRLLAETDMSMAALSDLLGFSCCSYFIQTFKRKEGITPALYRRGVKNKCKR